jgi:hypothetical protein
MNTEPSADARSVATRSADTASADAKGRDAVWPFVMIFVMMWGA